MQIQCTCTIGGQTTFFWSPQITNPQVLGLIPLTQIHKFPRCSSKIKKSANFLWFVRQSLIHQFWQNTAQLCLKTVLKVAYLNNAQIGIRALFAMFLRGKSLYLWTWWSFKSANHKKDWVHKLQTHKVSHLRTGCNYNIFFKSANLQIYLFAICGTYLQTTHLWPADIY